MTNRFGWIPDRPDIRDATYSVSPQALKVLPPAIDLRPGCPPVYDQGDLGSCTANAIVGALEFARIKQKLTDFTSSRLFLYYNERAMEGSIDSDAGASLRDGMKSVKKQGDCPETEWPYNITQFTIKPCPICYTSAKKYKVLSYLSIGRSITQLKGCLAGGDPFVLGVTVYDSFPMTTLTGIIPMPEPGENTLGGHAILCVGYDDEPRMFTIRNSWGAGWGSAGYGYLPYEYLLNPGLSQDFWTIRLVS